MLMLKRLVPVAPTCSRWLSCTCCRAARFEQRALPLPPKLPYSPTSHPFRRHLDALSLAIVSNEAETSWGIYMALHADLRRCIPDSVFSALLRHQLGDGRVKQRWHRTRTLVEMWKKCGLALKDLGEETCARILDTGLGRYLGTSDRPSKADALEIHALFRVVGPGAGETGNWLRFVRQCLDQGNLWMSADEACELALEKGAQGLADHLGPVLRRGSARSLRVAIICSNQGEDVSDDAVLENMDGIAKAMGDVEDLIRRHSTPSVALRYLALWREASQDAPEDIESALRRLKRADREDLLAALGVCRRSSRIGAPWVGLWNAFAIAVRHYPDLIDDFIRLPFPRGASQEVQRSLFHAALPTSYDAARRLYASVRAIFCWHDYGLWKKLFTKALDHSHTQMATRLYTDALADGLVPGRPECLRLIRDTCRARNASRPVLLERLVRDYIAYHDDTELLVNAIGDGLAYGNSEDAVLAVAVIKRLGGIPSHLAERLVDSLARVPLERQRTALADVLESTSSSKLYDKAISSIARKAGSRHDLGSAEALAICTGLYHRMIERDIAPTNRTLSGLLIALVKAGQLERALELFRSVLGHRRLRSDAVGRLMIALALEGRLELADDVERQWREHKLDDYDRGVVGARVLIDKLRGNEVDLDTLRRQTGWKGNEHFLRFIEGL